MKYIFVLYIYIFYGKEKENVIYDMEGNLEIDVKDKYCLLMFIY